MMVDNCSSDILETELGQLLEYQDQHDVHSEFKAGDILPKKQNEERLRKTERERMKESKVAGKH